MNDGSAFVKRRQLLSMLDKGLVMIHLDPRVEGVEVPERFKKDPVLRLNIAYGYRLPALDIGLDGVYAVLSFSKQNFGCTLPWSAIFALTSPDNAHEGIVWHEAVPPELRRSLGIDEPDEELEPAHGAAEGPRPALAEVEVERDAPPTREPTPPLFVVHEGGLTAASAALKPSRDEVDVPPPEPSPKKRPHLSIVKG